jgi:hypothetical protein
VDGGEVGGVVVGVIKGLGADGVVGDGTVVLCSIILFLAVSGGMGLPVESIWAETLTAIVLSKTANILFLVFIGI